jgi:glycosyltransferase involved in cell wall biosynthesis
MSVRMDERSVGGRLSGLHVLVAHPAADLYGSDRVMLESVAAMVDEGASVGVTVPASGPLVGELERAGATVIVEPALVLRKRLLHPRNWPSTIVQTLAAVRASRRLLRRAPDLVYVNTITLPLWPLLGRARGIPVLTHVHEAEAEASRPVLMALYAPHRAANAVIANSEFSRTVLARASPSLARRARVVYNGVAGPPLVTEARDLLDGRPVRLAYVGRLSPRKGPDLVIAAAARLVEDGLEVEVDLLGDVFDGYEWYEQELREAADRLGLGRRVRFLGFREEVWDTLGEADIVVIPSRTSEPFGNTAVEAALAARPLIVTDSSGLVEATAGLPGVHRVRPDDPLAIVDAVREIVAQWPDACAQARTAARLAAHRFDPARYREEMVDLVGGLVHPSPARHRSTQAVR